MSEDGKPDFKFWVFDNIFAGKDTPFETRFLSIGDRLLKARGGELDYMYIVPHTDIRTQDQLDNEEAKRLGEGYEGLILRDPKGPYKYGRSSTKEGWLLKLKRFSDAEAVIIGVQELFENRTVATKDAFGHTERSTHKENLVGKGTLGALLVKRVSDHVEFGIGTGFDAKTRQDLWDRRGTLTGKIVKYKFFDGGSKDAPRFPVFIGFRDPRDMS
jgi:DNA ligase-1